MSQLKYSSFLLERGSIDQGAQLVDASLSSEAPVERYPGEIEVLSHDPGAVDLTRARDGLPLLFAHDHREPIGLVENVRLESKRLIGRLRFGASQRAKELFADVQSGVLKNLSIGYRSINTEDIPGGVLVTRWEIYEASIVGVPLDASVGVGRSFTPGNSNPHIGEKNMNTETEIATTTQPENLSSRARIDSQIRDIVGYAAGHRSAEGGYTDPAWNDLEGELIQRAVTVAEARSAVQRMMAERSNVHPQRSCNTHMFQTYDSTITETRAMAEALASRFGVAPQSQDAENFSGLRVVDMARRCLELSGARTTGLNPAAIISRALHSTSDFPTLLSSTGERILRQAYASYQGGVRRICKQSTARDFRAKTVAALGEMPELKKVNQGGEFTYGTIAESSESYSLATYGRIFGISRQALVNDDLGAFADVAVRYGRAAAEFEAGFLASLLTSNPAMKDTLALFHANHGNLASTSAAISVATLGTARQALRLQKGLDGKTPIDATPRYLVVPAALETIAEQYVAVITANGSSSVNPFSGKLEVVVDPRLDAVSATAWYLAADSSVIDTIEYSYLETDQGPMVEAREGFETDGMEFKVRLDFGAGVLDWRGLFKNPGV